MRWPFGLLMAAGMVVVIGIACGNESAGENVVARYVPSGAAATVPPPSDRPSATSPRIARLLGGFPDWIENGDTISAGPSLDADMRIGPYPPAREGALDLVLRNPADGMSIQGATVGVTARMRHMEHGTLRSDGIERNGSDATAGSYRVPLHFAMHGEWIVTVTVRHDGLQESFDLLVVVSP